ncbi:MAG: glycine zipper 2TM domain-containing protein [Gemmatimonadota bacterium]
MRNRKLWTALLVLPLAILPVACGDSDDREALSEDELSRELDLALKGDSVPTVFDDSSVGLAPTTDPVPPQPAPRPRTVNRAPQRTPTPTPRPAPARDPAPAPSTPRTVTASAPAGTTFAVSLNETLSTKANAAGDGFTATLTEPILDSNGGVLIPSGATVRGRVTHVDKSDRVGETGVLNVAFESVAFGGRSYPLEGTVIEANPQRSTRQTTGQQAGKVAAGAAAGAVLGRVLGKDTKSTLKGAVIGAAAGTAIAMGTADVDVVLPAGSAMRVRLDAPIQVRKTVT